MSWERDLMSWERDKYFFTCPLSAAVVLTRVWGAQKNRIIEYTQKIIWFRNGKIIFCYELFSVGLRITSTDLYKPCFIYIVGFIWD